MSSRPAEIDGHRRADFRRNFERIVDGATVALAASPDASMSEIAEASGLARATLYRHFATREELLREIYRSGLDSAAEAIEAAEPNRGSAPEALRRVIDTLMVVGDRYRVITEQRLEYPDLLPHAEAAFVPFGELVERGQREGTIRDDLPPRWLTAAILVLVGEAIRAVGRGDLAAKGAAGVVAATALESIQRTQP
jgi:AcrR family transcriptional regulator